MTCDLSLTQSYCEFTPPASLAVYVAYFFRQQVSDQGPAYRHRTVPNGCVEIVASLKDCRIDLVGPQNGPRVDLLAPGASIVGAHLNAGVAPQLGIPVRELIDERVPLEAVWGREATELVGRLAERPSPELAHAAFSATLARRAQDAQAPDPLISNVVEALQSVNDSRVDVVARDLFMSPRHLRRRCISAVGYSPKRLQRLFRFQRYLQLSRIHADTSLASLAIEAGYTDQAHLTHQAVELAGLPPGKLLAETRASCGHSHDHRISLYQLKRQRPTRSSRQYRRERA